MGTTMSVITAAQSRQYRKQEYDFGSDRGIPVIVPAGSIAFLSSYVFHSSGGNRTDRLRRVFLAQCLGEVIMSEDGSPPWGGIEPFLRMA